MGKTEFTRVEGEKRLYQYRHQDKHSQWSTKYYGVFTDWKGIPRRFPLGSNLQRARNKLGEYLKKNDAEFDFGPSQREKKKEEARKKAEAKTRATTFRLFGEDYFAGKVVMKRRKNRPKRPRTIERERGLFENLCRHFGDVPLCDIDTPKIDDFVAVRTLEPITRGKKKGDTARSVDHELGFLRYILRGAVRNKTITSVPLIELAHDGSPRTGTVSLDEYETMLSHMGREQQRYLICLWETGMRLNEPRKLTWEKVDFRKRLFRLDREDVKEDWPRRTPITWELMQVLLELKEEHKRLPNLKGFVFTRKNGKPIRSIRKAFELAAERAGIPNAIPHDIRRSTISRWEALGIPRSIVMAASGHKPTTTHEKYIIFSDEQLTEAFHELVLPPAERKRHATKAAAAL